MNNKIAVQTGGPEERFGLDEAYRKIAEWGFDAVDANIDHLLTGRDIWQNNIPDVLVEGGKDFLELLKPWKEGAKKYGIDNYQAHAPFSTWVSDHDAESNDRLLEVLKNMIRGSNEIDCRNLIVHPFFPSYNKQLSPEDEWNLNIERYMKLAPIAKEYGVTVCLENMFTEYKGKIYAAICNDPDQAVKYIDTLNGLAGGEVFGFCLDTGHALLVGRDIKNFMTTLGSRIKAFHVHDNNGIQDQHLAPYMGVLDWNRFMQGLKEINYQSTLSFETFNVWNTVNTGVMDEMMRYIAACGRMFVKDC